MLAIFKDGDVLVHPKMCEEVVLSRNDGVRVVYDPLSRRRIDERLRPILERKLDGFRLLWKLSLKPRFEQWYQFTLAHRRHMQLKRFAPVLIVESFDKMWFYRRGLQILCSRLYYQCKQAMLEFLRRWKRQTDYDHYLKVHFFGLWSVKSARIKQNKLLAIIFIRLMRPKIRQVELFWKRIYYQRWLAWLKRFYELQFLRKMLRTWRIRVLAILLARRNQKLNALRTLHRYAVAWHKQYAKLSYQVSAMQDFRRLRKSFAAWQLTQRHRSLIMRVLLRFCRGVLRRAWLIWRHVTAGTPYIPPPPSPVRRSVSLLSPTRSKEPLTPKTRRRIVRKVVSSVDAYRQDTCEYHKLLIRGVTFTTVSVDEDGKDRPRAKKPPKVPAARALGKGLTLEERISRRLRNVHSLEEDYFAKHRESVV